MLRLLYQPYKWLFLFPFILINSLFFGIMAVTLSLLINQKTGSWLGGTLWAKLNTFFTPAKVRVSGREHVDKKQSYVIVANHLSAYDIWALYGFLGIDFKWVMKKEIRKYPGIGFGAGAVGHIFIDRSSTAEALKTLNDAKAKIRNGTSVIFFPEGTRSKTAKLLPFKKGAFKMAFDLNLPILPITINGTDKVWPTGTASLFPGKIEVIIHKPIPINGFSNEKIQYLINQTTSAIETARN